MRLLTVTKAQVDQYVIGKTWYWYMPLWLIGLYIFFQILGFDPNQPSLALVVPQSFDFFLHEWAHIFTAFLPPVLTAAAGSFSELLLGSLLVWGAFKTRSYFTSLICSLWIMLACQSVGVYMADARAQRLVLFSLGAALSGSSEAKHDWHFVFGELHLLPYDTLIGGTVRAIGVIAGLFGIAFTAWLLYKMAASRSSRPLTNEEAFLLETTTGGAAKATGKPRQPDDGITSLPIDDSTVTAQDRQK